MRSLVLVVALAACANPGAVETEPVGDGSLMVGFLLLDGVYNSELMAPYDVFQHTVFHAEPGMRVCTVGRSMDVVRTFEGLRILPDHDLESAPPLDVLVVPSGEHSMTGDLEDRRLIDWVRTRGAQARFVLSVCDGAFVLAEAGLLDGHRCTTYPGDIPALKERYRQLDVLSEVSFVVHDRLITGVGGAASYDPAMFLVETLYGREVARRVGVGLVIDWDPAGIAHEVVPNSQSDA